MVGMMPCKTPPAMLKKSPAGEKSQYRLKEQDIIKDLVHTQPDDDELDAESICRLLAVVFYNLRRKDDDPAGN